MSKRQRYYTPFELSQHNSENDCWVAINGSVYDITPLINEHKS